jgi:hypothetical protein
VNIDPGLRPGLLSAVPIGTDRVVNTYLGLRPGTFSAVPNGTDRVVNTYPGLTSWATLSRP